MRAFSIVMGVAAAASLVACGDNIKPGTPGPEGPEGPSITCGDGVVQAGEDCDDADAVKDNVCDATCRFTCGNGVVDVDVGEQCDAAIASGPGACPTTCDDGVACTADTLSGSGCSAVCVHASITAAADGDRCCPPGANATIDSDCTPVCGNTVVEPGEQCDDGNANNKDACANNCQANASATAFRFADLDLRDPHVFTAANGCRDVTDNKLLGFSLNDMVETAIKQDGNGDGYLDLSPTLVFRQLSQTAPTTPVELQLATCSAPTGSSSCMASGSAVMATTATNLFAGECLTFLPGTVHPYTPSITSTSASCFVTSPAAMTLDLRGIAIPLQDAQLAAHYVGFPADTLANGLIRGFLSEADAAATIVPISFPVIGGQSLGALLAGGASACPSFSDKDTHNGAWGWWVYLNFSGNRISWTE